MELEPFDLNSLKFPCNILILGAPHSGKSTILRHIITNSPNIPHQGQYRNPRIQALFSKRGLEQVKNLIPVLLDSVLPIRDIAKITAEYAQSWWTCREHSENAVDCFTVFDDRKYEAARLPPVYRCMLQRPRHSLFVTSKCYMSARPSWAHVIILCGVAGIRGLASKLHINTDSFTEQHSRIVCVRRTLTRYDCYSLPFL